MSEQRPSSHPGRIESDPPYWTCECGAVLDDNPLTRDLHALWHEYDQATKGLDS